MLHDSLVAASLVAVDRDAETRFYGEVRAWFQHRRALLEHHRHGVRIAPAYRRELVDQLEAEAERLSLIGDATWPVWAAVAESAWLKREACAMDPDER